MLPGESFNTDATILWNQKVDSSHLSELYAKEVSQNRLTSNYALPEAGTYHIKAVLLSPQTGTSVESSPLQVIIEEPENGDLDIWKTLKADANYAFFIQTGGLFEAPGTPATLKVARALERLLLRHPDSIYATHIRQSLSKHNQAIEQMK